MIKIISYLFFFEDRKKIFLFSIFTCFIALLETFGILFVSFFFSNKLGLFTDFFKFQSFEVFSILFLLLFFFFKSIFLNIYSYTRSLFVIGFANKKTSDFYKIYLNQKLTFYLKNNSSEYIKSIYHDIKNLANSYGKLLNLLGETFVFILIVIVLFYYNWQVTFFILFLSIFISLFFIFILKKKLKYYGFKQSALEEVSIKLLQQSFRCIRDIKIFKLDKYYIEKISKNHLERRRVVSLMDFLVEFPKNSFDLILILIIYTIVSLEFINFQISNFSNILVFLFAGLRVIPGFIRIIGLINNLNSNSIIIENLYNLSKKNKKIFFYKKKKPYIDFKKIKFDNINFSYSNHKTKVIKNLSIDLIKNKKYFLIGKSGSGKTTFADIICGLIDPDSGNIFLDEKKIILSNDSWRNNISYLSQDSVLFEGSILENITLNDYKHNINKKRLQEAIKISNLNNFLKKLPGKINYNVGENGSRLSGGQKQRVLIAKCIYKNANLIILDEFLSAIDDYNSNSILNSIKKIKNKTLILILHKYKRLRFADFEIDFNQKKIKTRKV